MKRFIPLLVALICMQLHTTVQAQRTTGTGKIADKGTGKYRGGIYWLSFGRGQDEPLQEGDKTEFTTPQGLKYTLTVTHIENEQILFGEHASHYKPLCSSRVNDYSKNNFPHAYGFNNYNGDNERIAIKVFGANANFDLELTVTDTNTGTVYQRGNIVIAGTESLSNNESYSLQIEDDGIAKLNVVETYVYKNKFKNLDVLINAETITDGGKNFKKITATNGAPDGANGKGDAMLVATDVHKIKAHLHTMGGQHFAVGILDFGDRGDLPVEYEKDPSGNYAPAIHITSPIIKIPGKAGASGMLTDGEYLFRGKYGEFYVTTQAGLIKEPMATLMKPILRIGNFIDFEEDPLNNSDATGDDNSNQDDEDGVERVVIGCKGVMYVYNNTPNKAYLHYWVDINNDGHFADDGSEHGVEEIAPNYYVEETIAGKKRKRAKLLYFDINKVWSPGVEQERFARFRISTDPNQKYYGIVKHGEVEDVKLKYIDPQITVNIPELTCDGAKGKVTFRYLPETGWRITLEKDGNPFEVFESFSYQGNPYEKIVSDLEPGSYHAVVTNGHPDCNIIHDFTIRPLDIAACDNDTYIQGCPAPAPISYPAVSPSGARVKIDAANSHYTSRTTTADDNQCNVGVPIGSTFRHLVNMNDQITYVFSEPVKSVDVWLLAMGEDEKRGTYALEKNKWYGGDLAEFEIAGTTATTTKLTLRAHDCNGFTICDGEKTVLTPPSNLKNSPNQTNIRVTVSADKPFTKLIVKNPFERKEPVGTELHNQDILKQRGLGFSVELCLNAIDFDTDNDGVFNNEDLDDDNDGILDVAESTKTCEVLEIPFSTPSVYDYSDTGFLTPNDPYKSCDGKKTSYNIFYNDEDWIAYRLARRIPAGTKIFIDGIGKRSDAYVEEYVNGSFKKFSNSLVVFGPKFEIYTRAYTLNTTTDRIRITMRRNGATRLWIYEITVDKFSDKTCHMENDDADGDGIPNHLDLDSDNDGCPDALESHPNLTWSDLAKNTSIDISPAGTNGVTERGIPIGQSTTDTGTSQNAATHADACVECDATINKSLSDLDGDGFADDCDEDNDNDGIPDAKEGFSCAADVEVPAANLTSTPKYNATNISGCNDGENGNYAELDLSGRYIIFDLGHIAPPGTKIEIVARGNHDDAYVYESFYPNQRFHNKEKLYFGQYEINRVRYYTLQDYSRFIRIKAARKNGDTTPSLLLDNVRHLGFKGRTCTGIDTDGDGIPDFLDLDSDNDGCPDAIEAEGSDLIPIELTENGSIDATSFVDGKPNNISRNIGTSRDPNIVSLACDTDGDHIPPIKDLDDDNDGILDTEETSCELHSNIETVGGIGKLKDRLYLFEWGGGDFDDGLNVGDTKTFTIGTGAGAIIITAEVTQITEDVSRRSVNEFIPSEIDHGGRFKDLYNTGSMKVALCDKNKPLNGTYHFQLTFTAMRHGKNYPINIVLADAERSHSLRGESISAITNGKNWRVLEKSGNGGIASADGKRLIISDTESAESTGTTLFVSDNATLIDVTFESTLGKQGVLFGVTLSCDYDCDGIPSELDLDSDNDGCPDALEGTGNIDTAREHIENASGVVNVGDGSASPRVNFGTTVDEYGRPINAGITIPQGIGASQSNIHITNEGDIDIKSNNTENTFCKNAATGISLMVGQNVAPVVREVTDFINNPDGTIVAAPVLYYKWFLLGGNADGSDKLITDGGIYSGATTHTLSINNISLDLNDKTFRVEITTSGNVCPAIKDITIKVIERPVATIKGTTEICQEDKAVFFTITGTKNTTVTYTLTEGTTVTTNKQIAIGDTGKATLKASNMLTSTVELKSIKYNNPAVECINPISGSATVTVNPKPKPKLYYKE